MTSSADVSPRIEPLPPALSSMWRLCRLGYRHEPRLIVTAFSLALLAAVPDALLAYWFKLLGDGVLRGDWRLVRLALLALGAVGDRHVVPGHGEHARAAPVPRQGDDRARVARGDAAGVDHDDRPPRAPRVSRPPVGAAQPGVHARPHVHVAVLDLRLDPAARRHRGAAGVDPSGAGAARRCSRCRRC